MDNYIEVEFEIIFHRIGHKSKIKSNQISMSIFYIISLCFLNLIPQFNINAHTIFLSNILLSLLNLFQIKLHQKGTHQLLILNHSKQQKNSSPIIKQITYGHEILLPLLPEVIPFIQPIFMFLAIFMLHYFLLYFWKYLAFLLSFLF